MKRYFLGAAAAAALVAGAAPASALTIDSFDTFQSVEDLTSAGNGNQVAAPEALGGWRDMYVEKESGPAGNGTKATSSGGILSFSNDSLSRGFGCVTWDGIKASEDCDDVDTGGLGGIDLLSYGPGFDFEVIEVDHMLEFTMKVWDTTGALSTYFEEIPPIELLQTFLPFSDFRGSANFADVGAIQIFVRAPVNNLDGSIGEVNVVPLPASALLLLGGLGGLSAFRARRKRS
jgi:hypothetical protein